MNALLAHPGFRISSHGRLYHRRDTQPATHHLSIEIDHLRVYSRFVDEKRKREKEIQDVMREERARGKKHLDTDEIAKQKRIETAIIEFATEIDDEEVFRRELTSLLEPETPRFGRALAT